MIHVAAAANIMRYLLHLFITVKKATRKVLRFMASVQRVHPIQVFIQYTFPMADSVRTINRYLKEMRRGKCKYE